MLYKRFQTISSINYTKKEIINQATELKYSNAEEDIKFSAREDIVVTKRNRCRSHHCD